MEGDGHPGLQPVELSVQNTVSVKVDFSAVLGLKEAELSAWIEANNFPLRARFSHRWSAFHPRYIVPQLAIGTPEGIVDSKCEIALTRIHAARRRVHHYVPVAGEREANRNKVWFAHFVMSVGRANGNAASSDAAIAAFEFGQLGCDLFSQVRGGLKPLNFEFKRSFHGFCALMTIENTSSNKLAD
jgi:hypothetical protein